ncbi:NUDIX domain-containing protein [Candidatus Falkowbacteria bacterium]|nr:NUDIX domain-containing protein [Candidatus Falkowbacteria bacterium]
MDKNYITIECAGGIVKNGNNIALVKMKKFDGWAFPKGTIETGEMFLEAAKREILEETGIKELSLIKELGTYQRPVADGQAILLNIHMFLFETKQKEICPIENDVRGAEWFFIDSVINFLMLEEDKKFFKSIYENIQ